jgi:hypothetical protein
MDYLDWDFYLDAVDILEDMEEVEEVLPLERVYRDRTNPFDTFSDDEFLVRFRLSKGGAHYFFAFINDEALRPVVNQDTNLCKEYQLFCCTTTGPRGTLWRHAANNITCGLACILSSCCSP